MQGCIKMITVYNDISCALLDSSALSHWGQEKLFIMSCDTAMLLTTRIYAASPFLLPLWTSEANMYAQQNRPYTNCLCATAGLHVHEKGRVYKDFACRAAM